MTTEKDTKQDIADRLNTLAKMSPTFITSLLSVATMVDIRVPAQTPIEGRPCDATTAIVDTLGLLNGLIGENTYRIVVRPDDNSVPFFEVVEAKPSTFITVNKDITSDKIGLNNGD